MTQDIASGVSAAGAQTGVHALVANAGSVQGAVVVQDALGATTGVGVALVACQAGARACAALGVGSTG